MKVKSREGSEVLVHHSTLFYENKLAGFPTQILVFNPKILLHHRVQCSAEYTEVGG